MQLILLWIRLSRPLFLLGAILVYALGAGIARYLGAQIDWGIYLIGQGWLIFLQLATHYFNEYYDTPGDSENTSRTPFSGGSGALGPEGLPRNAALYAALASLGLVSYLTFILLRSNSVAPAGWLLMALIFLGAFFYSVPPVRLVASGYGELTTSILVANLLPALAFLLQTGELHRLVAMSTFPLTTLHLAMMLSFEFPDYSNDLRHLKQTLLVRLGWRSGMIIHNILILTAYLLLGVAAAFGMPMMIVLPAFLTLPLGILQIWQMWRIAEGGKPNWLALTLTPVVLFGAMAYLLTFAFWTR